MVSKELAMAEERMRRRKAARQNPGGKRQACLAAVWTLVCLFAIGSLCGAAEGKPSLGELSSRVDALYECAAGGDAPGGSVIVIQSGRVLHERGYGMANLEHGAPNTPESKFRLASITKQFTAAAILQLQEAGLLQLDDPVTKYLPEFPHGDGMTVRHLLTHTAGLRQFEEGVVDSAPGERFNYSNVGYKLLGRIIEKVSGDSYEDYMRRRIFEPLGMGNSGCDHQGVVLKQRASGYDNRDGGGYANAACEDMFRTYAAGALYSTVEDMSRWAEGLFSGKVIKRETLEQALTPARLNNGALTGYGFGWFIGEYRGLKELSHGGDATGFNSWIGHFPDQDFTVVVLSNIAMRPAGPLPIAMVLGRKIADIYLGELMAPAGGLSAAQVDPQVLQSYVGRYKLSGRPDVLAVTGDVLTISVEDGRLYVSDKNYTIEFLARTQQEFVSKADEVTTLKFLQGADGKVSEIAIRVLGLLELNATKMTEQ